MLTTANLFFPAWFLPAIPTLLWLIMLPVNFLIDSAVLFGWLFCRKTDHPKEVWKKSILRIWLCGFAADFLASVILVIFQFVLDRFFPAVNVSIGMGSVIYGLIGALLGGFFVFAFDYGFALNKSGLSRKEKRSCAFWLALLTAPWLMALPTEWLYHW